jgi:hypothetical protein
LSQRTAAILVADGLTLKSWIIEKRDIQILPGNCGLQTGFFSDNFWEDKPANSVEKLFWHSQKSDWVQTWEIALAPILMIFVKFWLCRSNGTGNSTVWVQKVIPRSTFEIIRYLVA